MQFDVLKIGSVSSVNPAEATARVLFNDDDGMVSYDLQVLHQNTFGNKDYGLPDVGTDVLCGFLESGGEEGFILGAVYGSGNSTPEASIDKRTVVFKDGTSVSYDRASHMLTVTIDGTEVVFDRQNGTITVPKAYTVNCTTAGVKASGSVEIDSPSTHVTGTLTVDKLITGNGGFSISGGSGATCSVKGTIDLQGSMTSTGDVTAGGISLQSHTHTAQGAEAETSTPN
ncbi:MAG: phage baseplate assembly protein V [Sutterella sp.]